ncbi:MAG: NUDIX hydrolase [Pseudomonadota bacterium]
MTDQKLSAEEEFDGAKLVLFLGDRLAVIRRDDKPGLPFAGCVDLPGGMREPGETPQACVLREVEEELGLVLSASDLQQPRFYTAPKRAWFYAAYLSAERADDIVFGDEGQGWWLMPPWEFVTAPDAVPHFRDRVRVVLEAPR